METQNPKSKTPNIELIKELLDLATKHDVAELEWEQAGSKIKIKRGATHVAPARETSAPQFVPNPPTQFQPTPRPAASQPIPEVKPPKPEPASKYEEIKSPMVGTFYLRPRPDSPAYTEKDAVVEPGQTLCIIEAMKLMNEIEAEKKCRVMEILVGEGDPVEYGQVLFRVEAL